MPNTLFEILEIKRSNTLAAPASLANGELAYSFVSNTLFIGNPAGGVINVISNTFSVNLASGANTVAVLGAGTLIVANANLNFNNTNTVNALVTANGSQANLSFAVNASLNLSSLNVSGNISNTGNLLVSQNTFSGNLSVGQNTTTGNLAVTTNTGLYGVVVANASPTTNLATRVYTGVTTFLTASTARVSNSTINVEANLSMTVNEAGAYMLEGFLAFNATSNGVGGMKWDLGGGTATVAKAVYSGSGYVNGTQSNQGAQTAITTASAFATVGTNSSNPDWVAITGMLQVTVPGTVVLRYGQNSVTANAINLLANSFLSLVKVG